MERIKTPITYTMNDVNRFNFATFKDADGEFIEPERIWQALTELTHLRDENEKFRAGWLTIQSLISFAVAAPTNAASEQARDEAVERWRILSEAISTPQEKTGKENAE